LQELLPPKADGAPLAATNDRIVINTQTTFQYKPFIGLPPIRIV